MATISSMDGLADTFGRLEAMKAQEESTRCHNYFQRSACCLHESCRKDMVIWLQQMQRALELSSETVWIATRFLDRYVSSGKGKSQEALEDRYNFQLAAIAAFYTAVKIHEYPVVKLDVVKLVKICKGYYEESEILFTEEDILSALDWRVTTPTPMEFVRVFIELLPERIASSSTTSDRLLETSQKFVDGTTTDFYFTFFKPSVIGAACLASSVSATKGILSSSERKAFWLQLAKTTDMIEVMEAQNRLLSGKTLSNPKKTKSSITSNSATHPKPMSMSDHKSSPVDVFSFDEHDQVNANYSNLVSAPMLPEDDREKTIRWESSSNKSGEGCPDAEDVEWMEVELFQRPQQNEGEKKKRNKKKKQRHAPFSRFRSSVEEKLFGIVGL